MVQYVYKAQEITEEQKDGKDKKKAKIEPNKELIRLLKK